MADKGRLGARCKTLQRAGRAERTPSSTVPGTVRPVFVRLTMSLPSGQCGKYHHSCLQHLFPPLLHLPSLTNHHRPTSHTFKPFVISHSLLIRLLLQKPRPSPHPAFRENYEPKRGDYTTDQQEEEEKSRRGLGVSRRGVPSGRRLAAEAS